LERSNRGGAEYGFPTISAEPLVCRVARSV